MAEQDGSPDEASRSVPEERPEAQSITVDRGIEDAHDLLRRSRHGVLCTLSKRVEGWPLGSIAPFALDAEGSVILFISTIAEHTRNIEGDDRVSLLVQEEASGDVQAHGRLTLLGRAARVPAEETADVRARYLERVPSAIGYSGAHDFRFYRVKPTQVRFIGGFGRIFWLDAERFRLRREEDPLAGIAQGVIDHMNADHAEALGLYCRAFKDLHPGGARMVGIDQFGFDVEAAQPDVRLRFDFERPVTPETVRAAVVELVARARKRLAEKG